MKADFDLEGLAEDLIAFRVNVSFWLTDEHPLPPDIAEKLWTAHGIVAAAIEELEMRYGYEESGLTAYAPEGSAAED
jgi:hypothetical protein